MPQSLRIIRDRRSPRLLAGLDRAHADRAGGRGISAFCALDLISKLGAFFKDRPFDGTCARSACASGHDAFGLAHVGLAQLEPFKKPNLGRPKLGNPELDNPKSYVCALRFEPIRNALGHEASVSAVLRDGILGLFHKSADEAGLCESPPCLVGSRSRGLHGLPFMSALMHARPRGGRQHRSMIEINRRDRVVGRGLWRSA